MKKILMLVLTIIILTTSAVNAEGLTFAQLKEEVPERLVMTVTNKDGETINVDAPIIMPYVDKIPSFIAKRLEFDTSAVGKDYPVMKGENNNVAIASQFWNYDGSPFISFATYPDGKKSKIQGVVDKMERVTLPLGTEPKENTVTIDDIDNLVKDVIAKYSKGTPPDFRVFRSVLQSGLYYTKMVQSTNKSMKKVYFPVADMDKPVKNRTMELWDVHFAQYIDGVEVFTGKYRPSKDYDGLMYASFVADAWVSLLNEKDFSVGVSAFEKLNVIEGDNTFASFESLKSKLEDRIKNGGLKNIYEIRLGYNYQLIKGEELLADDNYNTKAKFILYPAWSVYGYDKDKDEEYAISRTLIEKEFTEPDELDILTNYEAGYQLRYNAVTGEYISNAKEYDMDLNK